MKGGLKKESRMAMVNLQQIMESSMKASGRTAKWKVKEF